MREFAKAGAAIAAAALLLMLPALGQRSPFFFWDTAEYLRFGQILASGLHEDGPNWRWLTIMGGRSPFYSVALWYSARLGGIWLPAFLQALCASYLLRTSLIAFRVEAPTRMLLGLSLWLSLMTGFGVYVGFLMPDIFAGLALLALAALLTGSKVLTRGQIVTIAILSVFALLAHSTNVVIASLAVVLVLAARWMEGRRGAAVWAPARLPIGVIVAAIGLSVGATAAIGVGAGSKLLAPPYLMARVLADGPGRTMLAQACDPPHFESCAYRTKPLDQHNPILWSTEPHNSVYATAGADQRARLSGEQFRFVMAAVAADPLRQAFMILRNGAGQLRHFETSAQPGQARASWDGMVSQSLPGSRETVEQSWAYVGRVPWRTVDAVHILVVLLSLVFLVWRLSRQDARAALRTIPDQRDAAQRFLATAMAATVVLSVILLANALLCGAASGVSARYQVRLIWLLPMLATVTWWQTHRLSRSSARAESRPDLAVL
jgi:hypothetical protein